MATLKIGGVSPETFDAGAYSSVPFHDGDVIVHSPRPDDSDADNDAPSPAPTLGEWHGRIFNVTLTPTDDGYVNTWACCSDDNFGANNKLRLKQTSRVVYMAYLRFRLGADDAPLELLERHNYTFSLRAATLRLRTFEAPLVDTTVYLVGNSSFHESNLTYDNAPPPRSISTSIAPPADLQLAYRENLGANFTDGIGWEAFDLDVERMGGVGAPVARGDRFAFQLRSTDSDVVSYSAKRATARQSLCSRSRRRARPRARRPRPRRRARRRRRRRLRRRRRSRRPLRAPRFSLDADTVFEVTGEDGARATSQPRVDGAHRRRRRRRRRRRVVRVPQPAALRLVHGEGDDGARRRARDRGRARPPDGPPEHAAVRRAPLDPAVHELESVAEVRPSRRDGLRRRQLHRARRPRALRHGAARRPRRDGRRDPARPRGAQHGARPRPRARPLARAAAQGAPLHARDGVQRATSARSS